MVLWILIALAAAGLTLATYLRIKKSRNEQIRCLFKEKCNLVLGSKYALFFGVPTEALGMAYYSLLLIGFFLMLFFPGLVRPDGSLALLLVAAIAFAFSVHQFEVQVLIIREWCSWCILSALINLGLIVLLPFALLFPVMDVLLQSRDFFVIFHIVTILIGVGAATISDSMSFRFLKDFRVSVRESQILEKLSQVIWFSVALFIVSGLGLFLPRTSEYLSQPKFLVKMIVVLVIIVNGTLLNLMVAPKLTEIPFNKKMEIKGKKAQELEGVRRLACILVPISIISWYSALTLGLFESLPFSFWEMLGAYVGLLVFGVVTGQVVNRCIYSRK